MQESTVKTILFRGGDFFPRAPGQEKHLFPYREQVFPLAARREHRIGNGDRIRKETVRERRISMKRHGALIALVASVMAMTPAVTAGQVGPTPVRYETDYLPAGGYPNTAIPEILSRAGEILGAINSPQRRSELAQQWLQYSKQVIAKEQEYRQQWLDFQRQQAGQQQQVEELRLEIARLQMQIEALRAQNARLERENLQSQAKLGQPSGDRAATGSSSQASAPQQSVRPRSGRAFWSSISALLFGTKPPANRDKDAP
jgi:hypothetical protein